MSDPRAASESWVSPRTMAAMREATGLAQTRARPIAVEDDVPGYRLGAELGRGAQGVVFAGVHQKTGRAVAIKIARDGTLLAARAAAEPNGRLAHEVRVLARLQHPHLVAVFDTGLTAAGLPYFVMDRVHGRRVDEFALECGRDVRTLCGLFAKFANAIHRAHLAGVVHRDLKPSNLQVDDSGEPRVLDFGLARIDSVANGQNEAPGIIGSLPWLSPEQAAGDPAAVDLRTDVYSLGLVLFDALCGSLPFDTTGDLATTLAIIRSRGAVSLRAFRNDCDFELDSILARCIDVAPDRRYESAGDLARDLERYRQGEPLPHLARARRGYVLRKNLLRHRVSFAIAAIAAFAILLAAIVSFTLWRRAEADSARMRRGLARNQVLLAAHALQLDNVGRARELLAEIPTELRAWEWRQLDWQCDRSLHSGELGATIDRIAASADGSQFAAATRDGEIALISVRDGATLQRRKVHAGRIHGLAFSPTTMTVWSAGADGRLSRWDTTSTSPPSVMFEFGTVIRSLVLQPGGALAAVVLDTGLARELCIVTLGDDARVRVRRPIAVGDQNVGLAFTSDGAAILSGEADGVHLRDVESLEVKRSFPSIQRAGNVAISHDGRRFVAANTDGILRSFDLASGREVERVKPHGNWIYALAFAPDDIGLLSAGSDATIKVWDVDGLRLRTTLRGHAARVLDARYCGGARLASGDEHGAWRVFAVDTVASHAEYRGHVGQIWNLAFAPDGRRVATVGDDRTLRVWDAASPRVAPWIARLPEPCTALAYSSQVVVCADDNGCLTAHGTAGMPRLWSERLFATGVLALEGDAEGRHGVAAAKDGDCLLFEMATGKVLSRWQVSRGVLALAISPAANRVAISSSNGSVVVCALPSGEVEFDQRLHGRQVFDVCWHPHDPHCLATASFDGEVRLTDVRTAACRTVMRGHSNGVRCLAFHPRGDRIATGGWDATVRIWDTTDGGLVLTLDGHDDRVDGVAFDPAGRRLASVSLDGTLRVWDDEDDDD